jgi:hypothetical protein
MKFAAAVISTLLLFGVVAATAQFNTPIQHVIVVIQENRTPDNLFGSNPAFENGVNITNVGKMGGSSVNLQSTPMYTCYDLGHMHKDFLAMWDNGNMDGAYNESILPEVGCGTPQPPCRQRCMLMPPTASTPVLQTRCSPTLILPRPTVSQITCSKRIKGRVFPRTNSSSREHQHPYPTTTIQANTGRGSLRRIRLK